MADQDEWAEHAAFMNALAEEGFVVLGGPLGDEQRILLVVDADSKEEIKRRLADDPALRTRLREGGLQTAPAHTEHVLNEAVEQALLGAARARPAAVA